MLVLISSLWIKQRLWIPVVGDQLVNLTRLGRIDGILKFPQTLIATIVRSMIVHRFSTFLAIHSQLMPINSTNSKQPLSLSDKLCQLDRLNNLDLPSSAQQRYKWANSPHLQPFITRLLCCPRILWLGTRRESDREDCTSKNSSNMHLVKVLAVSLTLKSEVVLNHAVLGSRPSAGLPSKTLQKRAS